MTTAQLNLMALHGKGALKSAYLVALDLWRGNYEDAGAVIDGFRKKAATITMATEPNLLTFLDLVGAALQNKAQFEPTACRRRLISAHDAAWLAAVKRAVRTRDGKRYVSCPDLKPPTLQEWKKEFKRLFPKADEPADSTLRRAAKELSLLYSPQVGGRPRGSKDHDPRKRRLLILKRRAKKAVQR